MTMRQRKRLAMRRAVPSWSSGVYLFPAWRRRRRAYVWCGLCLVRVR